ncbi:MAG: protein kinase [Myxococcales bacterium]|nr:protein kinase [Myxococcales bacterium]
MSAEPMMLGPYRLLEKLGQGGMAMVYRAERTGEAGFKKTVAIKRMIPQYRRSSSLLERFAAEARTNARLDHPNLVAVVDFGIDPEPFLVMEFVEGVTLATLLSRLVKKQQPLEISAACFIATEAAQGLDHAHRKRDDAGNPLGIVHRDVSPQNILLSNEGAVKVSDFGLVKAADNVVQTGSGVPIGKISYMAPEQADHAQVDARADVFSLGIVLWEMLAMRVLLPPNDPGKAAMMLKAAEFPPPSKYRPEVPPELDAIVMSCLSRDPATRTPSAQALAMKLREMLHEVAPGYGRDQLARLLGWAFPERGWQIDEPHAPPKQPSAEERLSIPPAPAVRPSTPGGPPKVQGAPSPPRDPAITGRHPPVASAVQVTAAPVPKKSSSTLWIVLGIVGVSLMALFGVLTLLFVFAMATGHDAGADEPPPVPTAPMQPVPNGTIPGMQPNGAGLSIESPIPGASLYRGGVFIGRLPLFLATSAMEPGPLVVVAPGHQPSVLTSAHLQQRMARGRGQMVVSLVPSTRPERAVMVQYPRSGMAWVANTREQLGPVPGLVLVPPTPLGGSPEIEVVEAGVVMARYDTMRCDPATVCVVGP